MVEEPWDLLVVATGSEPLRPPIDGIDLPGVYGLSVLQDGIELRKAIDAGPERAVIVGGGYIGLEAAEALVNRGVPTALVEAAPQVMGRIDPDMGELVTQAVRDIGVELYLEEEVEAIEGDVRARAVRTAERPLRPTWLSSASAPGRRSAWPRRPASSSAERRHRGQPADADPPRRGLGGR